MNLLTRSFAIVTAALLLSACDIDMTPRYQRFSMGRIGKDTLYCYHLTWGLDADAYYISRKKDVCAGFDTSNDICFGKGQFGFYFKMNGDTVQLLSGPGLVTFPLSLRRWINVPPVDTGSAGNRETTRDGRFVEKRFYRDTYMDSCEDAARKHLLQEVAFDTVFYLMACLFRYDTLTREVIIER